MPDVPSASLYRHIKILNDSAFIIVVEENRIRGTVENVYSLNREALEVDDENGTAFHHLLIYGKRRKHGIFFKKSVDSLPCMWWEYKDESTGRYRVVSSTIVLPEMQERVSCKCKTI